jgi:hypothetical protein
MSLRVSCYSLSLSPFEFVHIMKPSHGCASCCVCVTFFFAELKNIVYKSEKNISVSSTVQQQCNLKKRINNNAKKSQEKKK